MKLSAPIKNGTIEIICLLYLLLFVYAAVSKLLDFENLQVQLGQSPLLSAFAGWVSWGVPIVELIIALLLLVRRFRLVGLFAAFSLMVMFTTYIIIILNFSSFVPCSCGGILEKMGWMEHLIFNIVFVLLAAVGILLLAGGVSKERRILKPATLATIFSVLLLFSIGIIVLLFMLSEEIIHNRNNFVRRFPKHPTVLQNSMELPFDTYYIAGYDQEFIYLGNRSAPLLVTIIDTALQSSREIRINLPQNEFPFITPKLKVVPPNFYFTDGTVPCIYSGSMKTWKAELRLYKNTYFSIFEPISIEKAAIRAIGINSKERVIGTINLANKNKLKLNDNLLQKQIDGFFDTDGMLLYNRQLDTLLYTYYYRNTFLKIHPSLTSYSVGNTIDTISQAQVKIATIESKGITTLAQPPLQVNKNTATYGHYLFVDAALIGKFEPKELWQKASIIDVYDLSKNKYIFSFYIYNKDDQKMTEFIVINDLIISLFGKHLKVEKLNTTYYIPWSN
ncbi:MauE/DoxX family redox-associated membrane protein [Flavobacterium weaverense]|uniref:Putative membrane protein YphA (DoxX/SURF4 family) n=1 Tax=Flavobacterium weaverense TaxID=271156 RepID=A0A3L9ZKK1_9FLAO|nr:MauE/DoxX family redox-associated membrane protein [Flavobacterium weaverense]RMA73066.1 putative membrane protein YphA (DoxX/SURF4 family) [Flavobacterium weaverense]